MVADKHIFSRVVYFLPSLATLERQLPGVVGAVVGVDGKSCVIRHEASGHLDRVHAACFQFLQKATVELVDIIDVAE